MQSPEAARLRVRRNLVASVPRPHTPLGIFSIGLTSIGGVLIGVGLFTSTTLADGGGNGVAPLSSVQVPLPSGGTIVNQAAAVQLDQAPFDHPALP